MVFGMIGCFSNAFPFVVKDERGRFRRVTLAASIDPSRQSLTPWLPRRLFCR